VKSGVESMSGIISMLTEKVHQVMLISTQNGRAPIACNAHNRIITL